MPDYLEKPVNGDHEVVIAPQHLVNASWKIIAMSLAAVLVALVIVILYTFVGVDATNRAVDEMKADNTALTNEIHMVLDDLRLDHKQLVCRDVASYQEGRAVSDTIVVFLVALQDLAADQPINVDALEEAIVNLRAVQSKRDATINTCLNGSASEADELSSADNG